MKKLPILLALLMMLPAVLASVEVTYTFGYDGTQVDNVKALVYQCQNQDCSSVGAFPGKVNGKTLAPGTFAEAENGEITVLYPHYAPAEGYALFFVSPGYLPKEVWSDWSTGGFPTAAPPHSEIVEFNKAQSCSAPISSLSFENEVDANSPLVVNASAVLDAGTESAFSLTQGEIEYVPAQISQEYYSVDTNVLMQILDGTNIVYSDLQEFKNATGNALFAGSTVPISFTYVPTEDGTYTVKLTTEVVDDQCESYNNETALGQFNVLEPTEDEYCYTLVDDISVDKTQPAVGEQVTVTFSKYSGYKIGAVQQEIDTALTYDVQLNGNSVGSFPVTDELLEGENTGSFAFTPTQPGTYTVKVQGTASNALCSGLENFEGDQTLTVTTDAGQTYTVKFTIIDSDTSEPIGDADVTLASVLRQTDGMGTVTFSNVAEGTYLYTIEAEGYPLTQNQIEVYSHVKEYLALHTSNIAPVMNIPNIDMVYGTDYKFDLDDYVTDDHDSTLTYGVSYDKDFFDITISGSEATIKAKKSGIREEVKFTAEDSQGAKSIQGVTVRVRALAPAAEDPELSSLPDLQIAEDNFDDRALDLYAYAYDADTPDTELEFKVASSSSDVRLSIQQNRYLGVYPTKDFTGVVDATVTVTDGQATAQDTLQINVTPVNDAPRVIAKDFTVALDSAGQFLLNMMDVFADVDNALGDLTYTITAMDNITITPQTLAFLLQRDFVFSGSRTFDLTAKDPSGLNATAQFTLLVGATGDAPYIIGPIDDNDQIEVFEDLNFSIDLTKYEDDLEDGPAGNNNGLTWSVSDVNASLFTMWVDVDTDKLYISPVKDMNGQDDVVLTLTDSDSYTDTRNVTVVILPRNDAPAIQAIPAQNVSVNTLFTYQVNATDVDQDTLTYYDNTTLFDIDPNTGLINSTIGTEGVFMIEIKVCDDSGAVNNCTTEEFELTISDLDAPVITGIVEPIDPAYFDDLSDIFQFSANVTDNKQVDEVLFEFDGVVYTNGTVAGDTYTWELTNLTPGTYEYRFYANDTDGNIAASNVANWTLLNSNTTIILMLNSVRGNITVPQNTLVNAVATLLHPTGEDVTIYVDNIAQATNASPLLYNFTPTTIGMHEVMALFAGTVGYDASNETWYVNVTDGIAPEFIDNYTPMSVVFQPNYTFSIDVTDNVGVEEVLFEFDGSNHTANLTAGDATNGTWTVTVGPYSAGIYQFSWHARDARNNWNSTAYSNFTILPGSSNLQLVVNGVSANSTAEVLTSVPIFATVSNPVNGTIELYVGATQIYNGQAPFDGNHTFNTLGEFNVTAVFPGTTNVSAQNMAYVVTIEDTVNPELTNITEPADPSYYVSPNEVYQFSVDATDFDLDTVRLNFHGNYYSPVLVTGDTYTFNVTNLSSGTYGYSFIANDTSGNSIATVMQDWTLEKSQSTLQLTLDGVQDNITEAQPANVT
ncbi:hypothetical protein KY329_00445, partial [Candidatus Woesearchaeota archaeon]|nr:hypothetical protein [Candidatus Woesearchaeota archaeon]